MNSLLSYCEDVNGKQNIAFYIQNVSYDTIFVKIMNDIHGGMLYSYKQQLSWSRAQYHMHDINQLQSCDQFKFRITRRIIEHSDSPRHPVISSQNTSQIKKRSLILPKKCWRVLYAFVKYSGVIVVRAGLVLVDKS